MTHLIPIQEEKKRKKPTKLSDRSRDLLKEDGYFVAFVERSYEIKDKHNPGRTYWQKFDAFGVADLIAVKPGVPGTLYIQTTDHSNASRHKNTILGASPSRPILESGNRIHLHVWKKRTVNKLPRWEVQVLDLQMDEKRCLYFRGLGTENIVDGMGQETASLFEPANRDDF